MVTGTFIYVFTIYNYIPNDMTQMDPATATNAMNTPEAMLIIFDLPSSPSFKCMNMKSCRAAWITAKLPITHRIVLKDRDVFKATKRAAKVSTNEEINPKT